MLEKAKEERPATPGEVAARIRRLLSGEGETKPQERRTRATRAWRPAPRKRSFRARSRAPALLVSVAAACFMVLVMMALSRPGKSPALRSEATPGRAAAPGGDSIEEFRSRILSHFEGPFELDPDGYVTHWLAVGPFDNPDDRGLESEPVVKAERDPPFAGRGVARPDGSLAFWSPQVTPGGLLDLTGIKGWDAEPPLVALAAFWIECLRETPVELRFATTGGYEFLLDRRPLVASHVHRKLAADPLSRAVTLSAGWHLIFVKADHVDAKLTIQMRLLTPDGGRPAGLRIWN